MHFTFFGLPIHLLSFFFFFLFFGSITASQSHRKCLEMSCHLWFALSIFSFTELWKRFFFFYSHKIGVCPWKCCACVRSTVDNCCLFPVPRLQKWFCIEVLHEATSLASHQSQLTRMVSYQDFHQLKTRMCLVIQSSIRNNRHLIRNGFLSKTGWTSRDGEMNCID